MLFIINTQKNYITLQDNTKMQTVLECGSRNINTTGSILHGNEKYLYSSCTNKRNSRCLLIIQMTRKCSKWMKYLSRRLRRMVKMPRFG